MAAPIITSKKLSILKANSQMVIIISIASFITVFCLIASKYIFSQNSYQSRVIHQQNIAKKHLNSNIQAYKQLYSTYSAFINNPINIISGVKDGAGANDGSNDKIVLDALPSTYDFPALLTSVYNLLVSQGVTVDNISGSDLTASAQTGYNSNPSPVSMPFSINLSKVDYNQVQTAIKAMQLSIRPIAIDGMQLSGTNSDLTVTITAHSDYLQGKKVNITTKEVR